jgi:hypothetical protein
MYDQAGFERSPLTMRLGVKQIAISLALAAG